MLCLCCCGYSDYNYRACSGTVCVEIINKLNGIEPGIAPIGRSDVSVGWDKSRMVFGWYIHPSDLNSAGTIPKISYLAQEMFHLLFRLIRPASSWYDSIPHLFHSLSLVISLLPSLCIYLRAGDPHKSLNHPHSPSSQKPLVFSQITRHICFTFYFIFLWFDSYI